MLASRSSRGYHSLIQLHPSEEAPLKHIPETEDALVLRTDFTDDTAWDALCTAIREPVEEFRAYVTFVSEPEYEGRTTEELLAHVPHTSDHTFMFIVDRTTFAVPDHPILVVDLITEPGRTFRVLPSEMWAIENNLSTANMDFREFADAVDPDGVFRGFPES